MSCEYCKNPVGKLALLSPCAGNFSVEIGNNTGASIIHMPGDVPGMVLFSNHRAEGYIDIHFCPMCGRSLTPPEHLTLEQLREMDGEPVYTVYDYRGKRVEKWRILQVLEDGMTFLTKGAPLDNIGYGKTWIAYATRPGGED